MASVLGGVQSMFTAAWDEPFALPSEESATLALRTQQILAYETGVAAVADPLGGSYFVEALTDATEARIIEIMDDLERHGGMVRAIEDGYLQGLIADEAFKIHQDSRSPARGRSSGSTGSSPTSRRRTSSTYELDAEGRDVQLKRLVEGEGRPRFGRRGRPAWPRCRRAAEGTDNLMHKLIDCANAYCTVGEMVSALKAVWGEFQQPVVF